MNVRFSLNRWQVEVWREIVSSPPLPLTVDEITPAWLADALDRDVISAERTRIVPGTATKVLLTVRFADAPEPDRLCVKGGFTPELREVMAIGYETEARFYRDVAPLLDEGLPACRHAAVDSERGQGIVILEDLTASGATFCDARQTLTVGQTTAALRAMAGWHARQDLAFAWLDQPLHHRPMVRYLIASDRPDAYAAQVTAGPVPEIFGDRERVTRAMDATWRDEDQRPRRFIHGDANLTNVYLDPSATPRFVDWQFAGRGDAYHDVALFLIGALSIEDRRAHEQQLLREYLAARGDTADSFSSAWDAYRRRTLHGGMYALTGPDMQPAEICAALAERFAQAAVDLGTLGLLGV